MAKFGYNYKEFEWGGKCLIWVLICFKLLNGTWTQVFWFTLISRAIPKRLWLWDRERCIQFLINRIWTRGSAQRMKYLLLMIHRVTLFGRCYLLNGKGKILTRAYSIKIKRVQLWWRLMLKWVQVRQAGCWISVTFLWQIKLKKKIYRSNIIQQIICGKISWKIQNKEQYLGTLETTLLVEMKRVELVSEGNGKKNVCK